MTYSDETIDIKIREAFDVLRSETLPEPSDLRIRGCLQRWIRDSGYPRDEAVLTVEDIARYLNLSMGELIPLLDELPTFELAGRLRIRRVALERWVESREQTMKWQKKQSELKRDDTVIHFPEVDHG